MSVNYVFEIYSENLPMRIHKFTCSSTLIRYIRLDISGDPPVNETEEGPGDLQAGMEADEERKKEEEGEKALEEVVKDLQEKGAKKGPGATPSYTNWQTQTETIHMKDVGVQTMVRQSSVGTQTEPQDHGGDF